MNRTLLTNLLAVSLLAKIVWSQPTTTPTTQPLNRQDPAVAACKTGKNGPRFLRLHEQFVKRAREGNIDLLFLGDSITENWHRTPEIWKTNYDALHVANFGIGGDRTQHVLWRIENGELDGIHPKVVVLMIGTNNANSDAPEPIATAIEKIVHEIRARTGAKVLLLAIFPRDRPRDINHQMATIRQVNHLIARLDNGKTIRFLDIGPKFLGESGKLNQKLFSDGLHPNVEGYQVWADAMRPTLQEMMKD
jgi:lysophospholipase L1-like esterase